MTSDVRLTAPRYWPTWLALGVMRLLVLLPYRAQMALGRTLGRAAFHLAKRERRTALVNLRLSHPRMPDAERRRLVRRHFESAGAAVFETALAWWGSDRRVRRLFALDGLEHLHEALREGHGAILLSAHFTTLELGCRALTLCASIAVMYQRPKNPVIELISTRVRLARTARSIPSDNVRGLLAALKSDLPVWYAPDQREHGDDVALVPFFGIPVSTSIATSRIAKLARVRVLPYFSERLEHGGYRMRIEPPLENYPSDDPLADAARFHAWIEARIAERPEQYLWTYKRFKRPGPGGDPYVGRDDDGNDAGAAAPR